MTRTKNLGRRPRSVERNLPAEHLDRPTKGSTAIQVTQATAFSGPIPPPELLQHYNEIIPNGADRIVTMAENQSAHRIEIEKKVIFGDSKRANWGLFCGYTFGLVVVVLAFILILNGHDAAGTVLGSVDLATLLSVFIYGTHVRRQERERRDDKNKALIKRR